MNQLVKITVSILGFFAIACTSTYQIAGSYYTEEDVPKFKVNFFATSKGLALDSIYTGAIQNSVKGSRRALIYLDNIKVKKSKYEIEPGSLQTFERKLSGKYLLWERDEENYFYLSKARSMKVYLVIDLSSSLGTDLYQIKAAAKQMVREISGTKSEYSSLEIGVVLFSSARNVVLYDSYKFTPQMSFSQFYPFDKEIDQYAPSNNNGTALYYAMSLAVKQLDTAKADVKAMITFTDGVNNDWDFEDANYTETEKAEKFRYSNHIRQLLIASPKIASFTIGYAGKQKSGADPEQLVPLALNGGKFDFAATPEGVGMVFHSFAKSINSNYKIVYDRNASYISIENPIKIRCEVKVRRIGF